MSLTLSGTNGVVGAGFTVDNSGVSVTAGVGTFSSIGAGASVPAAGLTGALPTISAASLTSIPAANIVGVATAGFERTGGYNSPSFSARITTTTTLSTGSEVTIIFNVEDHDTDGAYNTSTGEFTVPSGKGGKYFIAAQFGIDDPGEVGDITRLRVYKNSDFMSGMRGQVQQAAANIITTISVSGTVTLAAGDVIKCMGYTDSNVGDALIEVDTTYFSMFRLSI